MTATTPDLTENLLAPIAARCMHQESNLPGRIIGTDPVNTSFVVPPRASNAEGQPVVATEQFLPALDRALASSKPHLTQIRFDHKTLTPGKSLSAVHAAVS
ncbi:truncated thiamine pyrophosphate-binding protein [Aminobacter sp. Y103A]|uniref:hypothetical protein n=1 Tax=Aminobacter sp. Y103A TaxID=1870862 RepID=UPI0025731833|nr:hypothetical protein [Aminobacter sp. SS-2016]BBD39637.1 truncated thiamine pyrophosphate-binding protein [Aminobacter sp. SS-2016]